MLTRGLRPRDRWRGGAANASCAAVVRTDRDCFGWDRRALGREKPASPHPGRPAGSAWVWKPQRTRFLSSALLWGLLLLVAGMPVGNLLYKAGGSAVRDGESWRREWSAAKAAKELAAAPVTHRRELLQSAKLGASVACVAVRRSARTASAWRAACSRTSLPVLR